MSTGSLLSIITRAGVRLTLDGDGPRFECGRELTDRQQDFIAQHRDTLAAELAGFDPTPVRTWLASIGEQDEEIIEDVLSRCRSDSDCLAYFLGRAEEVPLRTRRLLGHTVHGVEVVADLTDREHAEYEAKAERLAIMAESSLPPEAPEQELPGFEITDGRRTCT